MNNRRRCYIISAPFVGGWPFWTANVWTAGGKLNHHHFHPNGISVVKKEQCKSWHRACSIIWFPAPNAQWGGGGGTGEKSWPNIFKSLLPGKGGQVAAGTGVERKINIYYSYRVCLYSLLIPLTASDAPRKEQIDGDNLLLDINSFKDAE